MIVRVAGFGKALSIDLEDVFVRAEVMYQTMQSICTGSAMNCTLVLVTYDELV